MIEKRKGSDRRTSDRRVEERRKADRRTEERRKKSVSVKSERRSGEERRKDERRKEDRRKTEDRRKGDRRAKKESSKSDDESGRYEDIVAGRNAVLELLKSDKDINKLYIASGERHGSINEIIAKAKDQGVVIVEKNKYDLDEMAENNQGVVAIVPPFNYCDLEDILEYAESKKEDPFLILLDGIEDSHNLGAIIRTAETAGVHGIVIPKRRNAQVNSTVVKVSAGATSYMKIARVNNLNEAIRKLKENGIWIIGTSGNVDKTCYEQDLTGPIALVIGNEGEGMSNLVMSNSDILVKIPMKGKITSLNASVSTGIIVYEIVRQRDLKN